MPVELESEELDALGRIAWAEARGEVPKNGWQAAEAVAAVVLNRAYGQNTLPGTERRAYPDNVIGVIEDRKFGVQFAPMASLGSWKELPPPSPTFAKHISEWSTQYVAGKVADPTKGAVNFRVGTARMDEVQIGAHKFNGQVVDLAWDVEAVKSIETFGGVAATQVALGKLGYDVGPVDGISGPKTQAALAAFRQDYEIVDTPIAVAQELAGRVQQAGVAIASVSTAAPQMANVTYSMGPRTTGKPEQEVVDRVALAVAAVDPSLTVVVTSGIRRDSPNHRTGNTIDFGVVDNKGNRIQTSDIVHAAVVGSLAKHGLNELGIGMANGTVHAGFGSPAGGRSWGYPSGSRIDLTNFPTHVAAIQTALAEQGLYKGTVDGVYGPLTAQALADMTVAGRMAEWAQPEIGQKGKLTVGFEPRTSIREELPLTQPVDRVLPGGRKAELSNVVKLDFQPKMQGAQANPARVRQEMLDETLGRARARVQGTSVPVAEAVLASPLSDRSALSLLDTLSRSGIDLSGSAVAVLDEIARDTDARRSVESWVEAQRATPVTISADVPASRAPVDIAVSIAVERARSTTPVDIALPAPQPTGLDYSLASYTSRAGYYDEQRSLSINAIVNAQSVSTPTGRETVAKASRSIDWDTAFSQIERNQSPIPTVPNFTPAPSRKDQSPRVMSETQVRGQLAQPLGEKVKQEPRAGLKPGEVPLPGLQRVEPKQLALTVPKAITPKPLPAKPIVVAPRTITPTPQVAARAAPTSAPAGTRENPIASGALTPSTPGGSFVTTPSGVTGRTMGTGSGGSVMGVGGTTHLTGTGQGESYGGESDTVICTYFYDRGKMSRDMWLSKAAYGLTVYREEHFIGYHLWAKPLVRAMERGNGWIERPAWWLVSVWYGVIAGRTNTGPRPNVVARMAVRAGESLCLALGLGFMHGKRAWKYVTSDIKLN